MASLLMRKWATSTSASIRPGTQPPVGDSSFAEVLRRSRSFVDKSLLVAETLDTASRVSLILRPRRFGKSLNLSMLKCFFDVKDRQSNRALFAGLLIEARRPELFATNSPFGRHPVILLDLKGLKAGSWDGMLDRIRTLLARTFSEFDYLMQSPSIGDKDKKLFDRISSEDESVKSSNLENSLKKLSQHLTRHHGQPCVVLVDEYDAPLECAHHNGYFEDARWFFGSLFSALLKGNDENIFKVVLVGILRVAKSDFLSGLNNVMVYSFADPEFSDKFGFTGEEVALMLQHHQPALDIDTVRSLYDGYESADGSSLFNPWSIVCLCARGLLKSYWVDTGSTTTISVLLASRGPAFKELVSALLADKAAMNPVGVSLPINDTLRHDSLSTDVRDDDVWTLLYFAGYLCARRDGGYRIPNIEVASEWLNWVLPNVQVAQSFQSVIKTLLRADIDAFKKLLSDILMSSFSYFDDVAGSNAGKTSEAFYHAFVLGLLVSSRDFRYDIESNRDAGTGRFDIALLPQRTLPLDSFGILIEFKVAGEREDVTSAAEEGLRQIRQRNYRVRCEHLVNVCELGIGFKGKLCSVVGERLTKVGGTWKVVN